MHHDTARLRLYTHNIWGRHGHWDARRAVLDHAAQPGGVRDEDGRPGGHGVDDRARMALQLRGVEEDLAAAERLQ